MNFLAADNIVGIDAAKTGHSSVDLASEIHNHPFRNIIKAEPAAYYFGGVSIGRAPYGVPSASRCELITRLHLAAVIEGINVSKAFRRVRITGMSDLSRSSIVPANASACMRNMDLNQQVSPMGRHGNADDIFVGQRDKISARTTFLYLNGRPGYWRDGRCISTLDSRKPHAEKVSAHRPRHFYASRPIS